MDHQLKVYCFILLLLTGWWCTRSDMMLDYFITICPAHTALVCSCVVGWYRVGCWVRKVRWSIAPSMWEEGRGRDGVSLRSETTSYSLHGGSVMEVFQSPWDAGVRSSPCPRWQWTRVIFTFPSAPGLVSGNKKQLLAKNNSFHWSYLLLRCIVLSEQLP